jgi:hypothetical protein
MLCIFSESDFPKELVIKNRGPINVPHTNNKNIPFSTLWSLIEIELGYNPPNHAI